MAAASAPVLEEAAIIIISAAIIEALHWLLCPKKLTCFKPAIFFFFISCFLSALIVTTELTSCKESLFGKPSFLYSIASWGRTQVTF